MIVIRAISTKRGDRYKVIHADNSVLNILNVDGLTYHLDKRLHMDHEEIHICVNILDEEGIVQLKSASAAA